MSDRKPVLIVLLIGAAITLAVIFALDKSTPRDGGNAGGASTSIASAASAPSNEPAIPHVPSVIRRPSMAVAELGIYTDRSKADLDAVLEPKAAVALLKPQHCGDAAACDAVRAFLLAENHLRLEALPVKAWNRPLASDLPRLTPTLTDAERDKLMKMPTVVRVLVSGPPQPNQLPLRGGFGLAVALAEKIQGIVHDQITDRIERPAQFMSRVVTEPLGQSAFRKDRIDYQYATREGGNLRLITAGMIRYGAPDLEVFGAARAVVQRLADVLGALCDAMAGGANTSPITITLADVERARGAKFDDEMAMPPPMPISIDLEHVRPETGDPNDVMARVIPMDGPSPDGYQGLAATFFGLGGEGSSEEDEMRATRDLAQRQLGDVLARYAKMKGQGAALYVEVPFATATDGGGDPLANLEAFDFLKIEVTSFDASTITGTIYDDPGAAIGVKRGDTVTRKRTDVTDYMLRNPDGGVESASMSDIPE